MLSPSNSSYYAFGLNKLHEPKMMNIECLWKHIGEQKGELSFKQFEQATKIYVPNYIR